MLLTTQYLDEADRLADDIVVVDHGRIIARGDARSLKREVGGDQLHVVVRRPRPTSTTPRRIVERRRRRAARRSTPTPRSVTAPTDGGVDGARRRSPARSPTRGIAVEDLGLRQPTLDDVFLTLTGAPAEADDAAERPPMTARPTEDPR